jgi:hypothetical protein
MGAEMRKFLGIVVLAAGVGALGYWGAKDQALDMQNAISERAVAAVSGAVHGVTTRVEGRDIRQRVSPIVTLNAMLCLVL